MSITKFSKTFSNPNPNPNPRIFHHTTISNTNFNGSCTIKLRVCAKTKDFEINLTSPNPNTTPCGQFSAPVKPVGSPTTSSSPSSDRRKEDDEKQKYHVNLGYAIRSLREEFPQLLDKDPTFDIYRDDIVYRDPRNIVAGIENYKSIFWALRFHGRVFFKDLCIEVLRVWQPMENVILVRWTVHGIARVPWEAENYFDGISEYKLDKDGKIYEHKVDNIAPNSPAKFHMLSVEELIDSLGCHSTPKPTCFEFSTSSPKFISLVAKLKSAKHYLGCVMGFMQRSRGDISEDS